MQNSNLWCDIYRNTKGLISLNGSKYGDRHCPTTEQHNQYRHVRAMITTEILTAALEVTAKNCNISDSIKAKIITPMTVAVTTEVAILKAAPSKPTHCENKTLRETKTKVVSVANLYKKYRKANMLEKDSPACL